ncbi:IPT/TIG domain-containing protein [Maribacter litopenaei]
MTGTDFPSDASDISISFNGISADITSVTNTEIMTTVPSAPLLAK